MRIISRDEKYLALFVFLSRLPFVSHYLFNWDSVQFALALKDFNIAQHQPHPPGYILYVALGRIFNFFFDSANFSLVLLGVVASAITVALFYRLCLALSNNRHWSMGLSLVFLFNPVVWFYGEVALTYIFDALFSVLIVYLLLKLWQTSQIKYWYGLVASFALAAGFRQSLGVLFVPLVLSGLIILVRQRQATIKNIAITVAIFGIIVLAWFLPLVILTGGITKYWDVTNNLLSTAASATSILYTRSLSAFKDNFLTFSGAVAAVLNIGVIIMIAGWIMSVKYWWRQKVTASFYVFLIWIIPSVFVYTFIHFGQPGYIMTIVGAIIIVGYWPLLWLMARWPKLSVVCFAMLILAEIITFVWGGNGYFSRYLSPSGIFWSKNYWYHYHTAEMIKTVDNRLLGYQNMARRFSSDNTLLITEADVKYYDNVNEVWIHNPAYFRQVEYYLPEYELVEILSDSIGYFKVKNRSPLSVHWSKGINISTNIEQVLIITDYIPEVEQKTLGVEKITTDSGDFVYKFSFGDAREFIYKSYVFSKN